MGDTTRTGPHVVRDGNRDDPVVLAVLRFGIGASKHGGERASEVGGSDGHRAVGGTKRHRGTRVLHETQPGQRGAGRDGKRALRENRPVRGNVVLHEVNLIVTESVSVAGGLTSEAACGGWYRPRTFCSSLSASFLAPAATKTGGVAWCATKSESPLPTHVTGVPAICTMCFCAPACVNVLRV